MLGEGALAAAARRKLELFPDMHLHLVDQRRPARPNGWHADRVSYLRDLVSPRRPGDLRVRARWTPS